MSNEVKDHSRRILYKIDAFQISRFRNIDAKKYARHDICLLLLSLSSHIHFNLIHFSLGPHPSHQMTWKKLYAIKIIMHEKNMTKFLIQIEQIWLRTMIFCGYVRLTENVPLFFQ